MNAFFAQLMAGLATGGIYASLALALVMIYRSTHHVNFAQGEMAMFSTFIASMLITAGWPYWAAFFATVTIAFAMGAGIEAVLVRRLRNAPVLAIVVVFVALLVILHSLAGWLFGYAIRPFPSPFAEAAVAGGLLSPHQLGAIGVTLLMLALMYVFFRYSPLGLQMRATAENPTSSRLVGVRVNRMLALGWGLAGAIGAVAGMMIAPVVFLDVHMMSGVLLYAFAAAVLGGIGSAPGAVAGGFIVGVLENLLGTYVVGAELKLSVALVLIIVVLVAKPSGLFGKAVVARV
ncbi:branched-chain amino acid ABC transporter permease [Aquincola sp. S2]|uniref:Branched-chain amino acid ABC transporter permease n=1 Tax=Pseudaquabacterium terrae TaxID=2732868 RepID=A0ABX2EPH1_9BURK|nr:branched-chain amino acid ABC transporter permease [Aquabacterium terrae]NRF70536.1 branched-chain amino acid ABC transporter permease [Aquabacterium terrae]